MASKIKMHSFTDGTHIETPSGLVVPKHSLNNVSLADQVETRLNCDVLRHKDLRRLRQLIPRIVAYCKRYNQDWIFMIAGGEGSGKSNIGLQLAHIVDPEFELANQMVYSFAEEYSYLEFIKNFKDKPFRAVVFDEAVTALFSREHQKAEVRDAIKIFNMNRQLNHFSILIIPSFWSLDVDIRERRARSFIYVFQNEHNFGRYYAYYSRKKIPLISTNDMARKTFLSSTLFMQTVNPNYVERFKRMPASIESKYLVMKRDYFEEMMDDMNTKWMKDEEEEKKDESKVKTKR